MARPDNDLVSDQRLGFRDVLAQAFVGREQGSGTRQVIARFLETSGLRETDLQEVAQFGSNEAVKAGVGVAILSRWSVVEELAQGTLIALPLHDFSGKRPFYLVTRKKGHCLFRHSKLSNICWRQQHPWLRHKQANHRRSNRREFVDRQALIVSPSVAACRSFRVSHASLLEHLPPSKLSRTLLPTNPVTVETGFGIEPNGPPCTGSPTGLKPVAGTSQLNQSFCCHSLSTFR